MAEGKRSDGQRVVNSRWVRGDRQWRIFGSMLLNWDAHLVLPLRKHGILPTQPGPAPQSPCPLKPTCWRCISTLSASRPERSRSNSASARARLASDLAALASSRTRASCGDEELMGAWEAGEG